MKFIVSGGNGNGLTLLGNNTVSGIWVKSFSGKQIVVTGGNNTLPCVRATTN